MSDPTRQPQFPDTQEGQQAKRELAAWTAQYRKQAELERERDVLLRKVDAMEAQLSVVNLVAAQTELMRELMGMMREMRQVDGRLSELRTVKPAADRENAKPGHQPQKPLWRTYSGFRADMQHRERSAIDAQRDLEYQTELDIGALSGQSGSDSEKTIRRTMEHYHLDTEVNWPPSTWPEDEPVQQLRFGGHGMAAIVAATFVFGMADAVIDGRLDGVVNLLKLVGCHFGQPL